ncbi:MAG: hypothetical protein WBR10_03710 [Candidatus Acidiferrum sp.]
MYSNTSEPSELLGWQTFGASRAWSITITFLALALAAPVRSQEPPHPAESVAQAARNVREQKSNSIKHPKVITNDDLREQYLASSVSASPAESSSTDGVEAPKPPAAGCDNPDAERLKTDLQAAQGEQDQIRREITNKLTVTFNSNLDMKNFKPGSSGVDMGSLPLIETRPPIPERVTEVHLEDKIASLKRALRIACDSPEDATIQTKLDQAEQELNILQRQLVVDQDAYYSKTNYAADTAGKARLDAELQQRQYLQSEIERLKGELAASRANQIAK